MRRHDWADRMFKVIDCHIHRDFAYAKDDCSLFVARVVDAMTDSTLEQQLRDLYSDEGSANAFITHCGGLRAAVSTFLGEPSDARALRGDVVLFEGGEGEAVGIWTGREIVAMGETGLRRLPRREITAVWKV